MNLDDDPIEVSGGYIVRMELPRNAYERLMTAAQKWQRDYPGLTIEEAVDAVINHLILTRLKPPGAA